MTVAYEYHAIDVSIAAPLDLIGNEPRQAMPGCSTVALRADGGINLGSVKKYSGTPDPPVIWQGPISRRWRKADS